MKKYIYVFGPLLKIVQKIKQKNLTVKNTTPCKQKGEAIVHSVQQPLNLILYRSKLKSMQC